MVKDNYDIRFVKRSIELAKVALDKGDEPFGSLLVSKEGKVLYEGHNEVSTGDHTRHPEFEIARWAANNLTKEERATSTLYTSGEHCPMCSAAHGWVGLGKIVYAGSSKQLSSWIEEFGAKKSNVKMLSIKEVLNDIEAIGPIIEFEEELKELHRKSFLRKQGD